VHRWHEHPGPPLCGGGRKKGGPAEPQDHGLGRSRGGYGTKVHLVGESNGWALAATISPGQSHETQSFEVTMNAVKIPQPLGRPRTRPDRLAGDMAYNARWIRDWLKRRKVQDVIPRPESQQKPDQEFDKEAYRRRNIVERLIGWLKECRAVFTRYDKLGVNYLAMVTLAIIQRYLRKLVSSDRA
jgi:transposase